jgi:two-component system sensor histidine kinase KdpD
LPSSPLSRRHDKRGHRLWAFAATIGVVAAATLIASLLDPQMSLTVVAMIYLVGVMVISYKFSRTMSAVSAVLSVLGLNVFFVHPRGTFAVASTEHFLTLGAMLGAALLISGLSSRLRDISLQAQERELRARSLQRLAGQLAASDNEEDFIAAVRLELVEAFGPDVQLALTDRDGVLRQVVPGQVIEGQSTRHVDALTHCSQAGHALGPGTGRWDGLHFLYLPLRAEGSLVGALGVPAELLLRDDREHAQAIADLFAGAVLRIRHAAEALSARAAADSQQLRNTLLAAVSHDFRTPLASIVGAASSLQGQRERLSAEEQAALLALIEDEAQHLTAMTDNTLQWVRLSADSSPLRLDWESVEEVVGTTLARVRRRDPSRRIQTRVAHDLPLVRADAVMLAQLLGNLLDNALKYSDGPVQFETGVNSGQLQIDVLDRGPGIADDELPHLFDTFFRGASARSTRGAGLGLAISLAIARAHGGTLTAFPRDGGGTVFRVRLPLAQAPEMPLVEA